MENIKKHGWLSNHSCKLLLQTVSISVDDNANGGGFAILIDSLKVKFCWNLNAVHCDALSLK